MRFNSIQIIVTVLAIVLTSSARSPAEVLQGNKVTIAIDEVIDDDVYVFAQEVNVDGTIKGDLIVFGQQVKINGSIEGDLIAAAQTVLVNGVVTDDARIAGQVLAIQDNAEIGDDLIAAGYSLECTKASHIEGEVRFAGYQSIFAGRVEDSVSLASANSRLSGSFGSDIDAVVDAGSGFRATVFTADDVPVVEQGLTVTESANIAGDLMYQSTQAAVIDPKSTIGGEVKHSQIESTEAQQPSIAVQALSRIRKSFALLIVGVLIVYLRPKWTEQVVNNVQRRPLASLCWGILTSIAVIIGTILLLIGTIAIAVLLGFASLGSLIPAWLALGILATATVIVGFWIFSAWGTKVILSAWVGNRIINGPDWIAKRRILALGLGVLIFAALTWLPMVGAIVNVGVMLIGVGSTAIWLFTKPGPSVPTKQKT